MIKASYKDKPLVVDILSESFEANQSINYVVKQDKDRLNRIRLLMEYSFEICFMFGEVYLSKDKKACALILYPEKRKTNFRSVFLDFKLALSSIGIGNIGRVLNRESKLKEQHPMTPYFHIWFIGVKTDFQNQGIGSTLLLEILKDNKFKIRDIYLETSTVTNIPWYEKFGFTIVKQLDLGYQLNVLKKERQRVV